MIYPSNEKVLESVLRAFDEVLIPTLRRHLDEATGERVSEQKRALSNAFTISHLIRLTRNRVASQGQHYYDEMAAMEPLLRDVARLARESASGADPRLADELQRAADASWLEPGRYPSLVLTAERCNVLRLALERALLWLQANESAAGADARIAQLRARVRAIISQQLADEGQIVDGAFRGFGLRR